MDAELFSVEGLSTGYTHVPILHEVSLSVGEAEIVGLLGGNGSGKSTTLNSIAGVLRPWSGKMLFDGRDITKLSPWSRVRAGIALVPDGRRIFGPMTVRENLDVAARAARRKKPPYDEVFAIFPKLVERARQRAGSLSGGEQQMLAIGRALITQPRLLLIDEMSAGLSPLVTQELLRALAQVREVLRISMLVVEQSPHVVDVVGDRLYLLEQGTVIAAGSFESVGGADAIAELYLGVA
jgi:branched-chain amino acid transport system ATP-binding protein